MSLLSHLAALKLRFYYLRKHFTQPHTFSNYYAPDAPWLFEPELPIPKYITRIINVGCGSGRDFIPFDGKLELWGNDLLLRDKIKWVREFKNFTYFPITAMRLADYLEREKPGLSSTLVYTSGLMMYLPRADQVRLFEVCKQLGCTNFIFQEPPPASIQHPLRTFKLPERLFTKAWFSRKKTLATYYRLTSD